MKCLPEVTVCVLIIKTFVIDEGPIFALPLFMIKLPLKRGKAAQFISFGIITVVIISDWQGTTSNTRTHELSRH